MKQSRRGSRGMTSWGVLSIIGGITFVVWYAYVYMHTQPLVVQNELKDEVAQTATSTKEEVAEKWDTERIKNDPQFIELMNVKAEQKAIAAYMEDITASHNAAIAEAEARLEERRARELELTASLDLSLP